MRPPKEPPGPDDVIKGYEVVCLNSDRVFCDAKPKRMARRGWIASGLLACFCWPLSCVPCFMTCSYDDFQRPVYGPRGA